jgi:hypothetical protein
MTFFFWRRLIYASRVKNFVFLFVLLDRGSHGRKTLHQLIRHNIRVHMQPSDAFWLLLFDNGSVLSSIIFTRKAMFSGFISRPLYVFNLFSKTTISALVILQLAFFVFFLYLTFYNMFF